MENQLAFLLNWTTTFFLHFLQILKKHNKNYYHYMDQFKYTIGENIHSTYIN